MTQQVPASMMDAASMTRSTLASSDLLIPTGVILPYGGAAAPSGWRMCDGQTISRATYANLFAVIGEAFGAGDGSTTFRLPDLRGRVPAGSDSMGFGAAGRLTTVGTSIGAVGGAEEHTLTIAEMPNHDHPISHSNNATIVISGDGFTRGPTAGTSQSFGTDLGGGNAHNNVQPVQIVHYIIRT